MSWFDWLVDPDMAKTQMEADAKGGLQAFPLPPGQTSRFGAVDYWCGRCRNQPQYCSCGDVAQRPIRQGRP